MKKRVIEWLMAMAMALNAYSQEALNTDSLTNDFKYFIRLLEETHPDPYTNYGGKVDFRLKAQAAQQEISARSITTKADFQNLLTVFLAPLGDGHTYVSGSDVDVDDSTIRRFSRIYFRVIPDGLIVSEIPTAQASLLGSRLLRVNGHSVADLMEQIARLESGENIYDQYLYVVDYVSMNI